MNLESNHTSPRKTTPPVHPRSDRPAVPPLRPGERLSQKEFHRRYLAYPDKVKAELIGGVVHMPSPLRWPHGAYHSALDMVLGIYQAMTPGTEVGNNATAILSDASEPQPDLALRILAEYGGQSRLNEGHYVAGPPELLAEVADTTEGLDLGRRLDDYRQAGVVEYLVLSIPREELHWFHFPSDKSIKPNRQGVAKSRVFPGLWIAVPAILARDGKRLLEIVQQGIASRAHAAFVKRLEKARGKGGRDQPADRPDAAGC